MTRKQQIHSKTYNVEIIDTQIKTIMLGGLVYFSSHQAAKILS